MNGGRLAVRQRLESLTGNHLPRAANDNVFAVVSDYDTLGNLNYRSDNLSGVFEYACYDALNRLTQYAVGNGVTSCTASANNKVVTYDALGNITSKTGVGTYAYNAAGSVRPHAVVSIAGTVNGVVNPSYSYDANGNMTSGGGRTVTYTSFNMAATITQGTASASFTYDDGTSASPRRWSPARPPPSPPI